MGTPELTSAPDGPAVIDPPDASIREGDSGAPLRTSMSSWVDALCEQSPKLYHFKLCLREVALGCRTKAMLRHASPMGAGIAEDPFTIAARADVEVQAGDTGGRAPDLGVGDVDHKVSLQLTACDDNAITLRVECGN